MKKHLVSMICLFLALILACPAVFAEAGGITLIGQRSGGGSNAVFPATTASGTIFTMSGPLQISTICNGSFYGIDQGIEPHIRLNNYESFYDREALVEMIHNLK